MKIPYAKPGTTVENKTGAWRAAFLKNPIQAFGLNGPILPLAKSGRLAKNPRGRLC